MRESGILICSLFKYNHQDYIRFAKVASIEEYKQALNFWYPDMKWKLNEHKAWFHLSGNLQNIFTKIDIYINHVYSNVKTIKSSFGVYYCIGINHILRESFFEEIHKIVLKEIENDEETDLDLIKALKVHKYESRCLIYGLANMLLKNEKPINNDTYEYEYLIMNETYHVDIECKEYTIDPWNEEYPIIWSSNALKDLIFAVKEHAIILDYWQISKYNFKNISNFWMIDDTLNVRSKSINACITNSDIFYLFTQIGNIESFFNLLHKNYYDTIKAADMLNEYYDLLNSNETSDIPKPILSSLPHGKLFGHYGLLNHETLPTKEKEEEKSDDAVVLLANHITKEIKCILKLSMVDLLPEIHNLHTVSQADKEYCELLIHEFNKYKDAQLSLQTDLATLLNKKINYCNEDIIVSETKQTDKESSVKNIYTTRYVIEYLLQTCKLIPTDKWCPASMVLEIFMNYIQSLQKRKKEFAALQCHRNQLSIILADIVPKKRFVSGQMFQIQLPTPLVIEKTISELIDKSESN